MSCPARGPIGTMGIDGQANASGRRCDSGLHTHGSMEAAA